MNWHFSFMLKYDSILERRMKRFCHTQFWDKKGRYLILQSSLRTLLNFQSSVSHTHHTVFESVLLVLQYWKNNFWRKKENLSAYHGYISVIVTLKHFNPNERMCECENQTVVLCTLESQGLWMSPRKASCDTVCLPFPLAVSVQLYLETKISGLFFHSAIGHLQHLAKPHLKLFVVKISTETSLFCFI